MDQPDATPDKAGMDATDALPGYGRSSGGVPTHSGGPGMKGDATMNYEYNMSHPRRGMAVIVNNKTFDKRTGMNERNGTDVDAANLYQRLMSLGFKVHLFNNQTNSEMLRIFSQAASEDHTDADCIVCCILSHGDEGVVYGTDGVIKIDTLTAPFKGDRCRTLAGKPKMFFIQACRGSNLDHGVEVSDAVEDDSPPETHRIPSEADFLMAYSVVPGYFSWRNSSKGSWFIQALTKVLEQYGSEMEILQMMTRVNRMVAYEFESNASKEFMNRKKQIPCIVSMLTREVYFKPKKA